jgi:DNA modification methylase
VREAAEGAVSVRVVIGDCRTELAKLADESVNCCVTSPPYFGLRDSGVDGQIGLENTPDAFVAELVSVFREVRRVLRDDGTLWLNLGDSYWSNTATQGRNEDKSTGSITGGTAKLIAGGSSTYRRKSDLKPKDLIGIPWRVAFALQADGWYLRQDIIWAKPNPMPESVQDRCTKAHEYVFLLSKSPRYWYDAEAISEPVVSDHTSGNQSHKGATAYEGGATEHRTKAGLVAFAQRSRVQSKRAAELAEKAGLTDEHLAAIRAVGITDTGKARQTQSGTGKNDPAVQALADEAKAALGGYYREFLTADTRNARSVWNIATQPFSEAHFATFPPELAERCIKAGCPEGGTVLDPFGGAGTTGLVADRLQRSAILIELNPDYAAMAKRRIKSDAGMFGEIA